MKTGFIGYGSMGQMIIKGILNSSALDTDKIIISTRNLDKLKHLKTQYPLIEITDDNGLLAKKSDKIFVFVNTNELKNVIEEIKLYKVNIHLIHIAAGLNMRTLQCIFPGKISKVIPSLTSLTGTGITLINHNDKVSPAEKRFVENLFATISEVKIIPEENFEAGTNLTSSAPAFIAFIISKYADVAKQNSNFSPEEAEEMIKTSLVGTSKLLAQGMEFDEIIDRVATKGGITEEGLNILENKLETLFQELFTSIGKKYENLELKLEQEYKKN